MPTKSKQAGDYKLSIDYKGLVNLIFQINQNLEIIGKKRSMNFFVKNMEKKH